MAPLEMISTTLFLLTTTCAGSNSGLSAGTATVEIGPATDRAPDDRQPSWTSDESEPGSVPLVSGVDPSDLAPEFLRVPQLRSLQTRSTTGPGAGNWGAVSACWDVPKSGTLDRTACSQLLEPFAATLATNRTSNFSAPPGECAEVSDRASKRCVYCCEVLRGEENSDCGLAVSLPALVRGGPGIDPPAVQDDFMNCTAALFCPPDFADFTPDFPYLSDLAFAFFIDTQIDILIPLSFLAFSAICYWVVNGKRGRRSDGRHATLDQLLSKALPWWMVDNMMDFIF